MEDYLDMSNQNTRMSKSDLDQGVMDTLDATGAAEQPRFISGVQKSLQLITAARMADTKEWSA